MSNDKVFGHKDDGIGGTGNQKLRFDLIPTEPLKQLAEVYTVGAKKYSDRNWERGMQFGRIYGALLRHANAWWSGEKNDKDNGQHHLAAVAFNAFALMEYERTHPEYDDRPNRPRRHPEPQYKVTKDGFVDTTDFPTLGDMYKYKQGTDPDNDWVDKWQEWNGGV